MKSFVRHSLRALLLVLLVPALLVPSGLGLSVCLCRDMWSGRAEPVEASCCTQRAAQQDETCPLLGRDGVHTCEHCVHFQTADRELAAPGNVAVHSPLAMLPLALAAVTLPAPRPVLIARRAFDANDLAPPGRSRSLPLRI